jgi:DNA adenine methylase
MTDIRRIKLTNSNAKELFGEYKNLIFNSSKKPDIWKRGIIFYFLNRTAFSGNVFSGGYSQESYEKRLTLSSISNLTPFSDFLKDVKITDYSYEVMLMKDGKNVFIFLDPPYYSAKDSKLYGKDGKLHTHFDHEQFANDMNECKRHKWLITYDNSEKIRDLFKEFSFIQTETWELQYGVNSSKMNTAKKGKEIFISNFELQIE